MTLDDLIAGTRAEVAGSEPLDVLVTAARRQRNLAELGDQLLDHFVQEARAAGCSWSQIGAALGVTRQAAQQRHSGDRGLLGRLKGAVTETLSGLFKRFSREARAAVVQAQEEARLLGHDYIGTEHLLLGIAAQNAGAGAGALAASGVDLAKLRTTAEEVVGRGVSAPAGHIRFNAGVRFNAEAKAALERSLRQASGLGHNYIGTGHVLLALIPDGSGAAARILTRCDVDLAGLRSTVRALLAQRDEH